MKINNKLLKPLTLYPISIDPKFILINNKFYDFELDYIGLGIDVDGDTITTGIDPNYVSKLPTSLSLKRIKILKEININYNNLLKDKGIYVINSEYIKIKKSCYTYEITNKILLGLDLLHGDIIKVTKLNDDTFAVSNCNKNVAVSDDVGSYHEVQGYINITGRYKKMSQLDKTRLDVINGKNRSSEIKTLLQNKIDGMIKKIENTSAYKNGKITKDFIRLNPNMLDKNITKNPYNIPNYNDILNSIKNESITRPLGMLELYLFDATNRIYFNIAMGETSQNILSTKHCIGVVPVWVGDETISIMKKYESLYKKAKKLYKIAGLLNKTRKDLK